MKKAVILIVLVWIVFLFVFPIPKELDFYYYHVWECLQAHEHNMSYCVCSGFWKPPEPSDLENPCIIHPSENPYECIAHGSNLGTKVQTYGIVGYLLTDTTVYPPDTSVIENAPKNVVKPKLLYEIADLIPLFLMGFFTTIVPIIIMRMEGKHEG